MKRDEEVQNTPDTITLVALAVLFLLTSWGLLEYAGFELTAFLASWSKALGIA